MKKERVSLQSRNVFKKGSSALSVDYKGSVAEYYSYSTKIAIVDNNTKTLTITPTQYSRTTSKHCGTIKRAFSHYNIIEKEVN